MNPLYIAATASFIAGMCGYIMVRFWFIPIRHYRKVKKNLAAEIKLLDRMAGQEYKGEQARRHMAGVRTKAMQLLDVHRYELPYWYRLVLIRRQESPEKALASLMKLEKSSARDRSVHLQAARTFLKLL